MTQEEKATRYDWAIEKAKKELNTCGSQDCDAARQIFRLFPELKDEDDRIRENIIATIHLYYGEPLEDKAKEMIAWLEKQAQKPAAWSEEEEKNFKKAIKVLKVTNFHHTADMLQKMKYKLIPKQEWSEEDESYLNTTIAYLKDAKEFKKTAENCINWLKSIKERRIGG